MNKPFESYFGGKESDGTFQKIINLIPPHDGYIEGCLGNGTILRKKKRSNWSIAIDCDASVISSWLKSGLSQIWKTQGITFLQTDVITWLENFRVPAELFHKMGIRIFIYLDPPYPMRTRKDTRNRYTYEMTDEQHEQLLDAARLLSYSCLVMISSYPNELYDSCLAGWHTTTFESQTRSGMATEKLYMNYAPPVELHDYRYLGDDYRERERIKGIIYRNVSKFKRMPAAERNFLVEQLRKEKLI